MSGAKKEGFRDTLKRWLFRTNSQLLGRGELDPWCHEALYLSEMAAEMTAVYLLQNLPVVL